MPQWKDTTEATAYHLQNLVHENMVQGLNRDCINRH
jgi:hypothetical protein